MKKRLFYTTLAGALLLLCTSCCQQKSTDVVLERATPESVGMSSEKLKNADDVINAAIAERTIPGAVLAVVKNSKLVYLKAYGNKSVYPDTIAMTENTVFDLASLTKVASTAMSMAHLLERGGFRLEDKVSMYIPEFQPWVDPETGEKVDIRIIDLLTHSSGLSSYANTGELLERYGVAHPDTLMSYINSVPRLFRPTTRYEYSCLGFITLQNILQRITGKPLCEYAQENIFDVLGMKHTAYGPKTKNMKEIMELVAPTVKQPDGSVLLGEAQDPLGRVMNWENSGNSGLFSSAEDLALLAAALMNGGSINGVSVLGKHTVEAMTRVPEGFEHVGRSLGWENYSMPGKYGCMFHPTLTFAHTGHTGTSILVDPVAKVGVILLAHRV
ncbi:MAG: serine hydrolase, partial [Bacteroidaceae bacterium]|nr:serine hydrolase [Bacteroidaceae bacterium]